MPPPGSVAQPQSIETHSTVESPVPEKRTARKTGFGLDGLPSKPRTAEEVEAIWLAWENDPRNGAVPPLHTAPEKHAQGAGKRQKKLPTPDLNVTHADARVAVRTFDHGTGRLDVQYFALQFLDTSNLKNCFRSARIEEYGTAHSRWGKNDVTIELLPNRQLTNLSEAIKPKKGDWCLLPGSRALTETGDPAIPRTPAHIQNGIYPGSRGFYRRTFSTKGQPPPLCPPSPPDSGDDDAKVPDEPPDLERLDAESDYLPPASRK